MAKKFLVYDFATILSRVERLDEKHSGLIKVDALMTVLSDSKKLSEEDLKDLLERVNLLPAPP